MEVGDQRHALVALPLEKDTVTIVYEQRTSEAWLPTSGLLTITEGVQSVHREFPYRHGRRQTSGPTSTTSD